MTDYNNFQRRVADNNSGVGRRFEETVRLFFLKEGFNLRQGFSIPIGIAERKKQKKFDLGGDDPPILIECKSHTWTQGGNMPSAKMTVWNEAMYYFHLAPSSYRKIFCVSKHERKGISLAAYYLHTHGHMVPDGVEVWEFDIEGGTENRLL